MPEHRDDGRGDGDQAVHPTLDRLSAYLDGELRPDEAAQIGAHLDACAMCVAALDDLEEPPTPSGELSIPPPGFDQRAMRRAVRWTLFGVAARAALLLFVGAVALQLVGGLVVHPLLIDRGDRLRTAVAASIDVPVMTIPGAEVHEVLSNTGIRRRHIDVEVERAVGADSVSLGSYRTQLGPVAFREAEGSITPSGPWLRGGGGSRSSVLFQPERLADGVAVTVELQWPTAPLDLATADALVANTDEVVLLWVGFHVPVGQTAELEGGAEALDARLGYSACAGIPDHLRDLTGGGFGTSGGFRSFDPGAGSTQHALDELRRATANLANTGLLDDGAFRLGPLGDIDVAADWLQQHDPQVTTIVVTGSVAAVTEVAEAADPDNSQLLEIDLDRARPLPCG